MASRASRNSAREVTTLRFSPSARSNATRPTNGSPRGLDGDGRCFAPMGDPGGPSGAETAGGRIDLQDPPSGDGDPHGVVPQGDGEWERVHSRTVVDGDPVPDAIRVGIDAGDLAGSPHSHPHLVVAGL